ncbi:formyltransferase family protein [Acuticoccus sp.]|uniref:formyltransferase family protein n=1 Tax=Acuticoccus sp. TaxID=1904378 RepID=UPI003B51BA84
MSQTSVVLFGSLGPAAQCLAWLLDRSDVTVPAVVCRAGRADRAEERAVVDLARARAVPVVALEEVPEADLGLSVRFHQILRRRHLDRFVRGVVNMHGAPLPDMRGSMCECAAILEGRRTFGVSLHMMDEGVDTGPILAVDRFDVPRDATAKSLLSEANRRGVALVRGHFDDILAGRLEARPQALAEGRTYRAAELLAVRDGPIPWRRSRRDRRRRAFFYFEGAPQVPRIATRLRQLIVPAAAPQP